jgi:Flp pilus assembly protein TadG
MPRDAAPLGHSDTGASSLELAIVAPALLLMIFFGIQAGLFYYGQTVAVQSAREGVSLVRLAQDEAQAQELVPLAEEKAEAFASAVGRESLLDATAVADYNANTGRVSVEVTGTVITLVPGLDLTVTQEAFGEIERFEGDQ